MYLCPGHLERHPIGCVDNVCDGVPALIEFARQIAHKIIRIGVTWDDPSGIWGFLSQALH